MRRHVRVRWSKVLHWPLAHSRKLVVILREACRNGSIAYLLAIICLIPVGFNPVWPGQIATVDTLFVLDISASMNVRDTALPEVSRFDLAKLAVRQGMAALPCGSRVAIGLFAGDETMVLFEPLEVCAHYPAIDRMVSMLDDRMRWVGDSMLSNGLRSAIQAAMARKLHLVLLTDGDEMPHRAYPRLEELLMLRGKSHGLLVGIGSTSPQPVPRLDSSNQITGYWTPEEAVLEGNHPNLLAYVKSLQPGERAAAGMLDEVQEHVSALNRAYLQTLADGLDFSFARLEQATDMPALLQQASLQQQRLGARDIRWLFGLISMACVLFAWFWPLLSRYCSRSNRAVAK